MFKKIALVAAATLVATGASAAYKDGTYTGVGQGNASQIEVAVTVAGGKVSAVKVVKNGETPMMIEAAEKGLVPEIVKNNGTKGVEAVSGASNSSKGILKAVDEALAKAM